MNLNKKNITQILLITCLTVLFYVFIQNFNSVWQGVKIVASVFAPVILGICIAFVVNLPMSFIEKKLFPEKATSKHKWLNKIKRPVSLILGWLFIILIFTIFLMLIIPELYKAIMNFSRLLPYYMDSFGYNVIKWLDTLHLDAELLRNFDWNSLSTKLADYLESAGTALVGKTVTITTGVFTTLFNIILGFVFSCYFLVSKEFIIKQLKKLYASLVKHKTFDNTMVVLSLANETFSRFLVGQCAEACILGILCYIGMCILRIPYPIMISSLIAITALIPIFGAFIGTALGAFLILLISPIKALWFVIFILILQQIESNLIYPKVVGKSVGLEGVWVLFAVTLGGRLFGALGLLISVPVFSIIYCLIRAYVHTKQEENKPKPLPAEPKKEENI